MIANVNFSDIESDDEERQIFYSVCAQNKINDMIARMKELDENFDRPEEFENEAVSMAIQQHGLKNYDNSSPRDSFCDCSSEINENHCNQNVLDNSCNNEATTSKPSSNMLISKEDSIFDDENCPRSKQRKHSNKSEQQNLAFMQNFNTSNYDFDDVDFLNEAVAVAIRKKGLSSSSCGALK